MLIEHDELKGIEELTRLLKYSGEKNPELCAVRLLKECGSFHSVINADTGILTKISRVSERTAALFRLLPEIARIRFVDDEDIRVLSSPDKAIRMFSNMFFGAVTEKLAIASATRNLSLISCDFISIGSSTSLLISAEKIATYAIKDRAKFIFLSHNHPFGSCTPSEEDINSTRQIIRMLKDINVSVCDHIITAPDSAVSMRCLGYDIFEPCSIYSNST